MSAPQMFDKSLMRRDFSRAAPHYEKYATFQRQIAETLAQQVRISCNPDYNILDVGCGTGFLAQYLKEFSNITQTDIAEGMCEQAASVAPVVQSDMALLPFKDGSFQAVMSSLSLQWAENLGDILSEVRRVLSKDGVFLATTLGEKTLYELRECLTRASGEEHVSHFLDKDGIEENLRKAGFRRIEIKAEIIQRPHKNMRGLIEEIRYTGATNKLSSRRFFLGRNIFTQAEAYYTEHYRATSGISSTWEIYYISACK